MKINSNNVDMDKINAIWCSTFQSQSALYTKLLTLIIFSPRFSVNAVALTILLYIQYNIVSHWALKVGLTCLIQLKSLRYNVLENGLVDWWLGWCYTEWVLFLIKIILFLCSIILFCRINASVEEGHSLLSTHYASYFRASSGLRHKAKRQPGWACPFH